MQDLPLHYGVCALPLVRVIYLIVGAYPRGRPVLAVTPFVVDAIGGRCKTCPYVVGRGRTPAVAPSGRRKAMPLPAILVPFHIRQVFLHLGWKRMFRQILWVIRVQRPPQRVFPNITRIAYNSVSLRMTCS